MFEGIFQPMHLLVILVIVLIIFGPGKLPEMGNSLGRAIKGFKKAMAEPEEKSGNISEAKKIEEKKEQKERRNPLDEWTSRPQNRNFSPFSRSGILSFYSL